MDAETAAARRRQAPLDIGVYGGRGIPSTYGGYETFLTVLLPELARRGHRVTAYCRPGEAYGSGEYRGVRRVELPALRSKQLETLSHGLLASAAARLRRHDVVFVVNVANAPYCLAARLTGQRTVLNTDGLEWMRGKWGRGARAYFKACARLTPWSASAVICDCETMSRTYEEQFGARPTVIPYCWSELEPSDDPAVLARFGLQPYRYFLVAARLNPENNVAAITRAYLRSGARYPLLLLGAANYASSVAEEVGHLSAKWPGVKIGGHVEDRSDFATLMKFSAAYIHGHTAGGLNPSLLEAMGCGANVIAYRTGFNEEGLGDTGRYWSDFESELPALLRATEASGPPQERQFRVAARERVRRVFSVETVAEAHEDLFRSVRAAPARTTTALWTPWGSEEIRRPERIPA